MSTLDDLADTALKKHYTRDDWLPKLKDVKIRKKDEKKLVLNFLIMESSYDTVKIFTAESGTEVGIDLALLKDIQPVLIAVKSGHYGDAIQILNDLHPEMLNANHRLYFRLHLQRFIELCLIGDLDKAIDFGTGFATWCSQNQFPHEELERITSSLVLGLPEELLDEAPTLKDAKEINEDILTHLGLEKQVNLDRLLKMLLWAQKQLDEFAVYPRINDLAKATFGHGSNISLI
ncbi:LisH motif-containing protein [Dioscorea alata]|uniref:LisH motif-containing protein n=1 Tax=Dioscorea alata TaxID=55571 RepID=A0ACB7VXV1_DIOAL|nr:LisH motif-containing protein [Dioscorea alata]